MRTLVENDHVSGTDANPGRKVLNPENQPDKNELAVQRTELAAKRTRLAFDRTKRAAERTLMAWIRTSISMISFGFSIDTFFRAFLKAEQGTEVKPLTGPAILGLVLVGLGTLVLILGTIDHVRYLYKIGEELEFTGKRAPWTYMLFVALMVILIGMVIFIYLLVQ